MKIPQHGFFGWLSGNILSKFQRKNVENSLEMN